VFATNSSVTSNGSANPQYVHDALEVVRQYLETHFGAHPSERPGKEVCGAHPVLERTEYMLNGASSDTVGRIPYEPGGFVDKLMESFAGPHDFLGSRTGYDALGNLAHMSDLQHTLFNLETDLYIPIASVFAIPTLFSQYGLSAGTYLRQSKEANK